MRDLTPLDHFRVTTPQVIKHYGWAGDETCGVFEVPSPIDNYKLTVVASSDLGWDHVSVSRPNRCPNWPEMAEVKRLFFEEHETAMQLHVPVERHISYHPYCLHLWAPTNGQKIPLPPEYMVA